MFSSFTEKMPLGGAQDEFDRVFKHGEHPDEMPEVRVSQDDLVDGKIAVSKLVVIAGLASSNSEARRLIEQGGVRIDDVRVEASWTRLSL